GTDLRGPTDARHAVDAAIGISDESSRQTVLLLVTELATNAVVHGRPPCRLRVHTGQEWLRIAVSDTDPHPPVVLNPGPDVDHGRGLLLVTTLADAWGVDRTRHPAGQDGKVVWAEARLTSPVSPDRGVSYAELRR